MRGTNEMATEDQPLFNLQNEFKKLCVDFNKYCTSSDDRATIREDDSGTPTKATKFNEEPLPVKPSENFKPLQNKSRAKRVKVIKKTSRLSKKTQYHHQAQKSPSVYKNFPSSSCASCCKEVIDILGPHHSSYNFLDNRSIIEHSKHSFPEIDHTNVPETSEDDTTVNELAGYFETLVHIPKKMSQMAEMMYT